MKILHFIEPSTTNELKWDEKTNRYELTIEYVKDNLEVNFADDDVLSKRIKKNSRKIYNYLKYHSCTTNSMYLDVLLNKTEEGREFLKDVLLEQLEADNETGFNDLSSQPAVNTATGQVIERDELQRNQISVDTEQIIERCADYFGFNALMMMPYPLSIQLLLNGR